MTDVVDQHQADAADGGSGPRDAARGGRTTASAPATEPGSAAASEALAAASSGREASGEAASASGAASAGSASASAAPRIDVAALGDLLLGRWADARRATRALLRDERYWRPDGAPMAEHRERTLAQLRMLVDDGAVHRAFPARFGGEDDHGGNIASFEELLLADPSLQIKAGVQWGLFGAAILHLGTASHHERFLPEAMSLEIPGAFAMTETGHGSDVASIATTATYDPATAEFVIDTPFRAAWKDYLGNAAKDGRAAVVFAKLVTGGVDHGVHAFYVPIRDASGAFLPGIGGEDDGLKGGLNGIDNGRLHFNGVRVPRGNLLDRYGAVAEDGAYSSPIESPGRRFFRMLGTLVQGRVSLDGSATLASKLALTVAIRYGEERRQFDAGTGDGETVLMDYQRHQRRLLPRLAQTYAMSFAHDRLLERFDGVFSGESDTDADRQELETLAAALKPLSTWAALEILQEAREATGGAGFLAANRLTGLRADLDVYATFEGDNTVLLQLVAKRLLGDYGRRMSRAGAAGIARYAVGRVGDAAIDRSGLRRAAQSLRDAGSGVRSAAAVRAASVQRRMLADRVDTMVAELGARLAPARTLDPAAAAALFNANQDELVRAAIAHGELVQWQAFTDALDGVRDPATRTVMTALRDLFGLWTIERNLAWYLIRGRISAARATAITDHIDDRLLPRLRTVALPLTEAFGLEPEHIRAEVATGAEAVRQAEARARA